MEITIYHLFKRVCKGKVHWYYWFWENGKQVRKACKGCKTKREAEAYLELVKASFIPAEKLLIKDVAEYLYAENSITMKLREAHDRQLAPGSIEYKKSIINKQIIPKWGNRDPSTIEEYELNEWIITLDYSNHYRNKVIGVMNEIFKECKRRKLIKYIPEIETFKINKTVGVKDIFTLEELTILFPEDLEKIKEVWSVNGPDSFVGSDGKCYPYGLMFCTMFRIMVSTGMRPGEIRALTIDQIKDHAIYVNKMIDSQNQVQNHLKKGSENEPKTRLVIVPEKTWQLLIYWLKIRPTQNEFVFTYNNLPVLRALLVQRLNKCLIKNNIIKSKTVVEKCSGKHKKVPDKDRKLSPHSFRFTYNTFMVYANFPQEVLRNMIGHNSVEMTDYYTRTNLDANLEGLKKYQDKINEIWDQKM